MTRSGSGMLALCAMGAVAAGATFAAARFGVRAVRGEAPLAASAAAAVARPGRDVPPDPPAAATRRPAPGAARRHVVVDPGHGGTNLGGPSLRPGLSEKHLTLAIAFELRRALEARGLAVTMTREDDRYVSLRERVRLANRVGADVLVSVHLNATENHAQRGFETWILTPRALDTDARALRLADGPPRPLPPEVAALLDDVERGAALPGAARLAGRIQEHLAALRGDAHDRGVRQGSQDVLLGATMPAVLVELGFVDHPVEGEELLDPAVRVALAQAVADAIAADG